MGSIGLYMAEEAMLRLSPLAGWAQKQGETYNCGALAAATACMALDNYLVHVSEEYAGVEHIVVVARAEGFPRNTEHLDIRPVDIVGLSDVSGGRPSSRSTCTCIPTCRIGTREREGTYELRPRSRILSMPNHHSSHLTHLTDGWRDDD